MGQTAIKSSWLQGNYSEASEKKELCLSWGVSRKQGYTQAVELKRFKEGMIFIKKVQVKVTNKGGCGTQRLAIMESHYNSYICRGKGRKQCY